MGRRERILEAMERSGINRTQLALLTGVSQQAVTQIIDGKYQGNKRVRAFADVLGVTFDWLNNGDAPPPLDGNREAFYKARILELETENTALRERLRTIASALTGPPASEPAPRPAPDQPHQVEPITHPTARTPRRGIAERLANRTPRP